MKAVPDHLRHVLQTVAPTTELDLILTDARDCVLARDVVTSEALPRFTHATADGYAVRSEDVTHAHLDTPAQLRVLGDVRAGDEDIQRLVAGAAYRIMSGAVLPPDADAVVPLENTDRGLATVRVSTPVTKGQNVRAHGTEAPAGEKIIAAGTRLLPRHLAAVAALGMARVAVHPRPRVVVLSIGDEIVDPGHPLRVGQVPDVNSILLAEATRRAGADPFRIGVVPDKTRTLREVLEDQLVRADVVITTGGVSAGDYDVVREVLAPLGTVRFDHIDMDPASQQGFGTVGDDVPIFALPGKPAAALIAFEVFVRPALQRMRGLTEASDLYRPVVDAQVTAGWKAPIQVRQFMPVTLVQEGQFWTASPVSSIDLTGAGRGCGPGSIVAGLAQMNGLAIVAEGSGEVAAGSSVRAMLLAD
ncbi:MAG TPA: gephyrin-like molybdotransferase Glp [Actinomycetales bacterium]|nr:gephyrin-like molybdotransferase Glp [Actinomycetales bacterium]